MTRHFRTLDGMRGAAALAVVLMHVQSELMPGRQLLPSAALAVDFFFALSGFVLMHAYGAALNDHLTLRDFAIKRIIRLYPLYLLGGLMGLVALGGQVIVGRMAPADFLAGAVNLVMLPLPVGTMFHLYPVNLAFWSLALEVLANLVFAAFHRASATLPSISAVVGVAAAVLIAMGLTTGTLMHGPHWSDALGGLVRVAFAFSAGVLLYHLHRRFPLRLPSAALPVLFGLLMLMFAIQPAEGAGRLASEFLAVLVIVPAIVFLGAAVEPGRFWLGPMIFSGEVSYGLYATHIPIRNAVQLVAEHFGVADSRPLGMVTIAAAIGFAWLAVRLYDVPLRRFLNERFKSGRSQTNLTANVGR